MKTKDKSRLLINENTIPILPRLAVALGLNEAVILQQIHYWIEIIKEKKSEKHFKDGCYWTYNSYKQWQEQLPFWSSKTIMRAIKNLECKGIVVSANYNKWSNDHTKWYRIDYDALIDWLGQNDQADGSNCPSSLDKMSRALPKTTTETITEIDIKGINGANPNKVELAQCVRIFFYYYKEIFNKIHPFIKKDKLREVTGRMLDFQNENALCIEDWIAIIEKYFDTDFYCDYNICHFASEDIMLNRMYEVGL